MSEGPGSWRFDHDVLTVTDDGIVDGVIFLLTGEGGRRAERGVCHRPPDLDVRCDASPRKKTSRMDVEPRTVVPIVDLVRLPRERG